MFLHNVKTKDVKLHIKVHHFQEQKIVFAFDLSTPFNED
jgi:hypothetical protein